MHNLAQTQNLVLDVDTENVLVKRPGQAWPSYAGPLYEVALFCLSPTLAEEWAELVVWNEQRKAEEASKE